MALQRIWPSSRILTRIESFPPDHHQQLVDAILSGDPDEAQEKLASYEKTMFQVNKTASSPNTKARSSFVVAKCF